MKNETLNFVYKLIENGIESTYLMTVPCHNGHFYIHLKTNYNHINPIDITSVESQDVYKLFADLSKVIKEYVAYSQPGGLYKEGLSDCFTYKVGNAHIANVIELSEIPTVAKLHQETGSKISCSCLSRALREVMGTITEIVDSHFKCSDNLGSDNSILACVDNFKTFLAHTDSIDHLTGLAVFVDSKCRYSELPLFNVYTDELRSAVNQRFTSVLPAFI
ncbi:TPA: hypothetical protein ACX6RO_001738 [Photobacterium damselae]